MVRRRRLLKATTGVLLLSAGCLGRDAGSSSPTTDRERSPTTAGESATAGGVSATPTNGESDTSGSSTTDTPTADEPGTPTEDATVWRYDADAGIESTPVVGDGRVYAGTVDGVVHAHDTADGTEAWTVDLSEPIQGLTYADGTVMAVSGTVELWAEQTLYALDAADGAEAWTFTPTDWYLDVLGARNGTAYVATADDEISKEGTGETLYAVSIADGSTTWSAGIGDTRGAVVTDEAVYVPCYGGLFAFDAADGGERWQREMSDYSPLTAAVVGGTMVYATRDGDDAALIGLEAASGEHRFRFDQWTITSTVTGDGELYAGGETVAAFDIENGEPDWGADDGGLLTPASLGEQRVYTAGEGVTAYARDDGSDDWQWSPSGEWFVRPQAIEDGSLYVHARGWEDRSRQSAFAVSLATGEERWSFDPGTELTDFATDGQRVFAGGENGTLYALR